MYIFHLAIICPGALLDVTLDRISNCLHKELFIGSVFFVVALNKDSE